MENFKGELSEAGAVPSTKPSLFSKGKGLEARLAPRLNLLMIETHDSICSFPTSSSICLRSSSIFAPFMSFSSLSL